MARDSEDDALMLAALMQWQKQWPDAAIMIAAADRGSERGAPHEIGLRLSHDGAAPLIAIATALISAALTDLEKEERPDLSRLQRLRDALARLGGAGPAPRANPKAKR